MEVYIQSSVVQNDYNIIMVNVKMCVRFQFDL